MHLAHTVSFDLISVPSAKSQFYQKMPFPLKEKTILVLVY